MRFSDVDCEKVMQIICDLGSRKIDGMLTREISTKYGLSMRKTFFCMTALVESGFEADVAGILGYNNNDGSNGFLKHTNWFFY